MDQTASSDPSPINWDAVWQTVFAQLTSDELTPKFLTEDGIRVTTLRALQAQIDVVQLADIEYGGVNLGGGQSDRLDLVVHGPAGATVVEFKYPREPRQTLPPWPDHLGSFFSDTYRLGSLTAGGQVQRAIQLLVSGSGFLGFLQRTTTRLGLGQYKDGDHSPSKLTLTPTPMTGLSATTRGKVKRYEAFWNIDAVRTAAHAITGKSLWLAAYDVQGKRVVA